MRCGGTALGGTGVGGTAAGAVMAGGVVQRLWLYTGQAVQWLQECSRREALGCVLVMGCIKPALTLLLSCVNTGHAF
jgi:hypothetical protein